MTLNGKRVLILLGGVSSLTNFFRSNFRFVVPIWPGVRNEPQSWSLPGSWHGGFSRLCRFP